MGEEKNRRALERTITQAHQSGALSILAQKLAPLLQHHHQANGRITAVELEKLIARVAEEIIDQTK